MRVVRLHASRRRVLRSLLIISFVLNLLYATPVLAQVKTSPDAPVVIKVEPPNWWLNLTPDVMLLLTGSHLNATHVACNLPDIVVNRTQSSANGDYLFVWLKFGPKLQSGTAVCRVTTPNGESNFEFPIAARKQILGRNLGLATEDVIYLVVPDRFANGDPLNDEPEEFPESHDRSNPNAWHGGDLHGVRDQLPYLKDLGITTICLTPIVKNGGSADFHGYAAVDLYSVDPHLGTLRDYQELVEGAHKQRMKLFFDLVPNHVGPGHPWAKNPPMPDWFHGTAAQHTEGFSPLPNSIYGQSDKKEKSYNLFESLEDPHATRQMTKNLTEGWFLNILPDLNTENPVVVEYLIQNSIWWTETSGLDGYRIDAFPYVARKFWEQWHSGVRKLYPRLSTIGEVFHPDPTVTSFFVGGHRGWDNIDTQLTTVFDYPAYFAIRDVVLQGASAGKIPNILRQDSLYPHPEYLVPFIGNQGISRFAGMPAATPTQLKLAFGLIVTLRGIPELYYGDEIAMPGGADPDNRRDFPGGWQEDPKSAFTATGRTAAQQEIFQYVQTLLRLRREHDALRTGKLWHLYADDNSYIFVRESEEEKVLIAFNNSLKEKSVKLSLKDTPAEKTISLTPLEGDAQANLSGRELTLLLPPQSISILQLH